MSEILLAGVLRACAGEIAGENMRQSEVVLKDIAIDFDIFGMPIVQRRIGSSSKAIRLSRLDDLAMARVRRLQMLMGLVTSEVDCEVAGESKFISILFSNEPQNPVQYSQSEALIKAILSAENEGFARVIFLGGKYRAAAEALARNEKRAHHITTRSAPSSVQITKRTSHYIGFYSFENLNYAHKRFDGGMSNVISRDMMVCGDASVILPYDPIRDEVVLIEQIRPAALARGTLDAWGLEAVAGLIGIGEDPRETAMRECEEEAGLSVSKLYDIAPSYQSPGSISQLMYLYIGCVDLSNYHPAIHGLAEENEDIKSHVLSRKDAIALLRSGEVNNAPLQLCLYALALDHEKIRQAFA